MRSPAQISDGVMCNGHQSVDLTQDTGHIGYIYIGEWSDRYGYIYIYFSSGGGRKLPVKPYFFSFFYFPQSTLHKDMCILLLMKPAVHFRSVNLPGHTSAKWSLRTRVGHVDYPGTEQHFHSSVHGWDHPGIIAGCVCGVMCSVM